MSTNHSILKPICNICSSVGTIVHDIDGSICNICKQRIDEMYVSNHKSFSHNYNAEERLSKEPNPLYNTFSSTKVPEHFQKAQYLAATASAKQSAVTYKRTQHIMKYIQDTWVKYRDVFRIFKDYLNIAQLLKDSFMENIDKLTNNKKEDLLFVDAMVMNILVLLGKIPNEERYIKDYLYSMYNNNEASVLKVFSFMKDLCYPSIIEDNELDNDVNKVKVKSIKYGNVDHYNWFHLLTRYGLHQYLKI